MVLLSAGLDCVQSTDSEYSFFVILKYTVSTTSDSGHTAIVTAFMGQTAIRTSLWVGSTAVVVRVARLFHASGGIHKFENKLNKCEVKIE